MNQSDDRTIGNRFNKTVSVIIPVYNAEAYLRQCLDSVVAQTLDNIEVLCIDDGSQDSSYAILQEYASRYPFVKLLGGTHIGVGKARNTGIRYAKGMYIAFMDSDDYYPDKEVLQDLYSTARAKNAEICGGSFSENRGSWIKTVFDGEFRKYTFDKEGWISYRDYQYDYGYHRFLYRRSMLTEHNIIFPDYIRFQDPPFFVHAMVTAARFYALPRVTYCYRCGHQMLRWDLERAEAVLNGLIDNLTISRKENLDELHCLTARRLLIDYRDVLVMNLSRENETLLKRLFEADVLLKKELLKADGLEKGIFPLILSALKSRNPEEEEKQYLEYRKELENIYHSRTYRIGVALSYLPKKIRELLK